MIRLAEVSHHYRPLWPPRHAVRALDRLSLEIKPGSAVGLIGVNGAGKTTLLRLLLGYLQGSSGMASIESLAPRRYVELHGIGYVPERVAIPRSWTVEGALRAYTLLGNVGADGPERVEAVLERLGLQAVRRRRVGGLSKGNLQRLAIAQAIVCDRRILVLDEPTDGLDPVWIAELRGILAEWRAAEPERILVIASHDLALVERVSTRVVVLHDGRVLAELDPAGKAAGSLESDFLRLVRTEARAA
jgi:ABC-2 type transport system ATP-binding protein